MLANVTPLFVLVISKRRKTTYVTNGRMLANVTPLFNRGSRTDVSNYRPVSLTQILWALVSVFY